MRIVRAAAAIACVLGCMPMEVRAAPIAGITNISGSFNIGTSGALHYTDFFGGPLPCATPGVGVPGCFAVNAASTGDFPAPGPAEGVIQDLLSPPLAVSGNENLPAWITFLGGSNVVFDLTSLVPGSAVDCATLTVAQLLAPNQACTPYFGGIASPFTLTNDSTVANVALRFTARVDAFKGSKATGFSLYQGEFTSQVGGSLASVLVAMNTPSGIAPAGMSYSAGFQSQAVPAVPEPATLTLLTLGLAGFGGRMRRRR